VATILTVIINIMAGYALAKFRFRGRDTIFYVMIGTLMIPLQVIMVPIFLLLKDLGLLNTLWGIIIPPAATPTGIFLARQYILTIPDSLIEAARIDGGSEFYIFRAIILPLSKPIIATIAIFSFMWRWNDFLWPFIVISRKQHMTIQLALANFVGQFQIHWGELLAMTAVTMMPMIIVFLVFQKYFIKGITAGGVKY
jgi:alpha-1,4-digalacturonate transport system permease protein